MPISSGATLPGAVRARVPALLVSKGLATSPRERTPAGPDSASGTDVEAESSAASSPCCEVVSLDCALAPLPPDRWLVSRLDAVEEHATPTIRSTAASL